MSTGVLSIGVTGIQAAQLGLLTTEHNITNASTPGYNRQRTVQASNIPLMTGAGAVGQGTHVQTIARQYDQFLTGQVNSYQAQVGDLDTYYAEIKQIDNMLADPNSGVSPALQDFFRGVQQVAANPSQMPSRQAMVASAQALVDRFHGIEDRLTQMADGVNGQITDAVASINSYAQQIASLNERIVLAQASANQPANDLLDQRDQLVDDLNKMIKVSTVTNGDGSYSVFVGTGQQLVVGMQANTMTATASVADPTRIVVGLQTAGKAQELPEFVITGGQLGGLVRFRSESLDQAFNELGRVSASLALTFNAQHALGQDLLGQSAGSAGFEDDFFDLQHMQPNVIKNALNTGDAEVQSSFAVSGAYSLDYDGSTYTLTRQSDGYAWSGSDVTSLQDANGVALPDSEGVDLSNVTVNSGESVPVYSVSASANNFLTNLTVSDYRLSFDGASSTYTVTRLSDKQTWSNSSLDTLSATLASSEGFSLKLNTGTMADGDSFLIQPTRGAARNIAVNSNIATDPRLIAVGLPFRTGASVTNTGTGAISNGQTVAGYQSGSLPPGGIQITYSDGAPPTLALVPDPGEVRVANPDGTVSAYTGSPINYVAGARISFAGMSFQMTGQPSDGDTFNLSSNTGSTGIADSRNAVLLGNLQVQSTMAGGTANYQEAYAQFVSDTGNKTREAQVTGDAQHALLEQSQGARDALSGVNLDEEAANMLHFQQAYQAAAKMLDIGGKLFDTLLSLGA